jgi:hypothetical protein
MRRLADLILGMLVAGFAGSAASSGPGQSLDEDLRIYAVNVVKTPPLWHQIIEYGIYLGQGIVITAAHVAGNWPSFTHPTVRIAGRDFPTKILKEGSFKQIDLALLAVDQAQLPTSLLLRRNPLCNSPPRVGMEVIDVVPQGISWVRVISPLSIAPQIQRRFNTLIDTPKPSGSGIFDPERKCLLGIMSAEMPKYGYQLSGGKVVVRPNGFAGYFVPASQIASFTPPNLHF